VKAAQYSVVAFPKLDSEAQIQDLREQFPAWYFRVRPYVPIVLPFTPATLDEIQNVSEHVGRIRRNLHSLAISFSRCIERGESLFFQIEDGRDDLVQLHAAMTGAEPQQSLLSDVPMYEPQIWLGRVADPRQRCYALAEANRIGRSLGVIDAVTLLRIEPDEEHRLVATFPFGIGRVDYYDRFTV
jgi:hypothetical protein